MGSVADTLEQRTVTLEGAQRVVEAALTLARRMKVTISVAVGGLAGDLKAFARMDGASTLSAETARRKVQTVAMVGMATHEFGASLRSEMAVEPELFEGMLGIEGIVAFAGGVPISVRGEMVGAVGVSGASSQQDREIAEAAAAQIR
jgi:glc operon protein GlcG